MSVPLAQAPLNAADISETDELFVGTRGMPPLPSAEEWQHRVSEILGLMDEWMAEDPAYDRLTFAQLQEALEREPIQFRRVSCDG